MNKSIEGSAQTRQADFPLLSHSFDGYIRLSLSHFHLLPFIHLYSSEDADFLDELHRLAIPAASAGYSEWVSDTSPPVSIAWGWFIHGPTGQMLLAPDGVRSNVMLVDRQGYDLGPERTANLFGVWLGIFSWQSEVRSSTWSTRGVAASAEIPTVNFCSY
ncbi:DUF4902 domain-containing protein [Noviherbaspirillum humi]|uniref:DUF4902 domain-containing protein n=1 Tax=Noviherbaspirillum humi TaxID=1688639 RepID=UPI001595E8E4|nr:DUF4902 domain-containing protein [Noviherbaspirillum humi]